MWVNKCSRVIKLGKPTALSILKEPGSHVLSNRIPHRCLNEDGPRWSKKNNDKNQEATDLVPLSPKEIIHKEFPDYFSDGKFITRISYVDFIDQALEKMKDLGLEKDLEAYKELLRVFPPGKYDGKSTFQFGLFHAPQQLCAVRLLHQMELNMVKPDKEVEAIVVDAFSKNSAVWLKIARINYWSMKGRNVDPNPLPEKLPQKTHELAKVSLIRMLEDQKSVVVVTNTSSLPEAIDRTWIVYAQSPTQQEIIDRLDKKSILYIEDCGLTFVGDKYLSYFALKVYDDEETIRRKARVPEPDFNYNTLKMKFYGKPLKEKLEEMNEIHHIDDCYILALGITGTSSHDSVLSWLKLLQRRNPNLNKLNVVFKLDRPTNDLIDLNSEQRKESDAKRES